MRPLSFAALLAPAAAEWWGGAPDCAQSCLSSYWSSVTPTSDWPSPATYCTATPSVASCISSDCSATPTAWSSYSSASSSLCSQWSSCSSAGSTGVYTVSWNGPSGRPGGPGGWGGNAWASTYTGGQVTVTGCAWDGSPWYGPGNGDGWGGWGDWGHGWDWTTRTTTVTQTVTATDGSGSTITTIGLATVAEAVSGDVTSTTTLASATGTTASSSATGNAAPRDDARDVKAIGALLGAMVAAVGML